MKPGSRRDSRQARAGIPSHWRFAGDTRLPTTVGALLRSARESQGLTQYQLADLSHVSRGAISDIERGTNLPNLEALVLLSRVLNVDALEVFERVDLALTASVDLTGLSLNELKLQANSAFRAGDHRRALAIYDAMSEYLRRDPPAGETERRTLAARIEVNRAEALRQCGAFQASEAAAKRAVLRSAGIPRLLAKAYVLLAALLLRGGNPELAATLVEEAVRQSEHCGDEVQALALAQKGAVLYRAGRFEQARSAFVEARARSVRARDHQRQIIVESGIGSCLVGLGRRRAGRARLLKAVRLARKHGHVALEASRLVDLARLSLDDGDGDDAERFALAALRVAKPAENHLGVFRAEWVRHLVAEARGHDAADRHRIAHLRKLYRKVKGHAAVDAVAEFERRVLTPSAAND